MPHPLNWRGLVPGIWHSREQVWAYCSGGMFPTRNYLKTFLCFGNILDASLVSRELASNPSCISASRYTGRFGSWMNALSAFVDYANGTGAELVEQPTDVGADRRHKTGRNPSLRLRWHVLQRDNFKCCACGSSPAITLGVELHVDHIFPWEKGGETVLENLQTLCSRS